jgi:hypothetical protein
MRRFGKGTIALAALATALTVPVTASPANASHSCVSWYNTHGGGNNGDHYTTIVNGCSSAIYARVVVNYYQDSSCAWIYSGTSRTFRIAAHLGPTGDGWAHC